ncbi:DUF6199 family natural product biosynthesis protein [Intestinimonas sp.]|uniref:DUF6199 family natural product biosynthesis protein n=1 Tax=Intestinimonas sp. TaxID=1965293 RepID=UPI00261E1004|nr:DUF6199 family natural product biosynthesis protein [Intestinimonas sp.]
MLYVVILLVLGGLMVAKPEFLWKLEHLLTVKDGEPTELYLTLMRLGGGFFVVAAIGCGLYLLLR